MIKQSKIQHWKDLLPSKTESNFEDSFAKLTSEQLEDLAILSRIRWLIKTKKAEPNGASAKEAKQIEQAFAETGIDFNQLLSEREKIRQSRIEQATNKNINGQTLKLSGVILPLHWNENRLLTHFLLMPYLGQCSHFPPPPPNQVIYAKCSEPIDIQKLTAHRKKSEFSLWVSVEGQISLKVNSHNVFRVDGMLWLESTYEIICQNITCCTSKDIAEVLEWQTKKERTLLYPKLTELIPTRFLRRS
ncbi:MAG: DUF3299 domain-containing protein [Prochloraceae cyanobacterium]|nr:DUF3299 domain-containing protein [Prochloraceae cyanobacterium]